MVTVYRGTVYRTVVRFVGISLIAGVLIGCQPIVPEDETALGMGAVAGPVPTAIADESATPDAVAPDAVAIDAQPTAETATADVVTPSVAEAVTADTSAADTSAAALDPALVAAGREAYLANYCGTCHRLTEAGTGGVFGPRHDGMGTIAQERIADPDYAGSATDAAGYIRESIVDPYAHFVPTYEASPHRMPPYVHLPSDTIDAMVAYLLAQE